MAPANDISFYDSYISPSFHEPQFSALDFHHPRITLGRNSTGELSYDFPCTMDYDRSHNISTTSERVRGRYFDDSNNADAAASSSTALRAFPNRHESDFVLPPWSWPASEPGPSYYFGGISDSPVATKHTGPQTQVFPSPPASQATAIKALPSTEFDMGYMEHQRYRPSSDLLSPLSLPHGLKSDHLGFHDVGGHRLGLEHAFMNESPTDALKGTLSDDEEIEFPMSNAWHSRCHDVFSSPFSDDSDSDDGLSPSPFSSPETTSEPDEVDEEEARNQPHYFSPPSTTHEPRYHPIDEYPDLDFYQHDDDGELPPLSLSFSTSSPLPLSPLSASSFWDPPTQREEQEQLTSVETSTDLSVPPLSPSTFSNDAGLQSPALSVSQLPSFDLYPYDHTAMPIPGSPSRRRSKDLPMDNEFQSNSFGLDFQPSSGVLIPASDQGSNQRTTWLSLPGAETDDDLIPADLASKNYIPEPGLAVPSTPSSRSLLIWDPTTRSGLPATLPVFDGSARHRRSIDAYDLPQLSRSEETFDVDPGMLAELSEKDAKKGEEVQKLCELRQRTNVAAATAAGKSREGGTTQWEAERVRERWRELTALLRLKLSQEEKAPTTGVDNAVVEVQDGDKSLSGSSTSSTSSSVSMSTSSATDTVYGQSMSMQKQILSLPGSSSSSISPPAAPTSSPPQPNQRRSSKPKITSMAQLVANMVFHRQQEALRRSPARSRTWPQPSSVVQSGVSGSKKKLLTQATPRSPLRQMILPEDGGDNDEDVNEGIMGGKGSESPLQLSPLCLCASPEGLLATLEASPQASSPAGLE